MLPSLAVAFLIGLVCGAQVQFFPLSVLTVLVVMAVGLSLVERNGYLTTPSALVLYLCVCWAYLLVHEHRATIPPPSTSGPHG